MRIIIFFFGLFFLSQIASSQTTRYFEFITACGHVNWQDTSFIAATSDSAIIDSCLSDLAKPLSQRRFISGNIAHGNDGYNHNANHWFGWHFIPDQWQLVEIAAEVCDGCPFTDLDNSPEYWIDTLGFYCPWSGQIAREIQNPAFIDDEFFLTDAVVFPNPVVADLNIKIQTKHSVKASVYNLMGENISSEITFVNIGIINLQSLNQGLYFLRLSVENNPGVFKFIPFLKVNSIE